MFGPSPDVACIGVTHDDGTVFARAPDRAMSDHGHVLLIRAPAVGGEVTRTVTA